VRALREYGDRMVFECPPRAAYAAAVDLAANKIVGWFEGRSELGPRALGHRSLLADARVGANWAEVNRIKGREAWRPFAPAVLEEDAEQWFSGCPFPSPYMLFTATVTSKALPAITHVDGSARIQTVNADRRAFFELLQEFKRLTGVSVVLNTSFNGPGEPIVETPEHALRFLVESELDVLYVEGWRVVRA
jgi:carbamoyltransferase